MRTHNHQPKKEEEVLKHESQAWDLRVNGWSQTRIAEKLGVTQQAVSVMLKRASAKFSERFMQDIKVIKDEQVAQLSLVADESLQAWFKSKVPPKKKPTPKGKKPKPEPEFNKHGDPRYLTEFRRSLEDIRKILGADAPLKISQSIKDEVDLSKFTQEQLDTYISLLEILHAQSITLPNNS